MNLFHRNFDQEREARSSALAKPSAAEPSFSRSEVDAAIAAAKAEAFAAGRAEGEAAGRAEALAGLTAEARDAALAVAQALQALHSDIGAHRAAVERDLMAFLAQSADAVVPELMQSYGPQRFAHEVRALLKRVGGSEKLHIKVAPQNLGLLRSLIDEALAQSPEEDPARFALAGDPSLDPTAVSARWQNGASDYSYHRVCAAILQALTQVAPALPRLDRNNAVFFRRKSSSPEHSMTGSSHDRADAAE